MIGTMSGTSADGVDAALVEISGRGEGMSARYVAHVERPYDADLRRRIFAAREGGQVALSELAGLGRDVTMAYADAVRELLGRESVAAGRVGAIAAHGQTLYHAPPLTVQWLDPSLLAFETGMAVVSDFRRADCAAGGQGAPLVPFGDWILFRHPTKSRVIVNLGGIANLTWLPAGGGVEEVIAFDTGPGNCVSDWIAQTRLGLPFDEGGRLALTGADSAVWAVEWMEQQSYPSRPPPKSTDVPDVLAAYQRFRASRIKPNGHPSPADELATAAGLVTLSIAEQILRFARSDDARAGEVFVGGGGVRNAAIMAALQATLGTSGEAAGRVATVNEIGVPSQAREAVCFAILGAATLDGEPSNVPGATGARSRAVLGSVTPARGGGLKSARK